MPEELDDELEEMYEEPKRREKTLSNEVLLLPLKTVRLQPAVTISPSASVREAVEQMQRHKIGCVLVVESKTLTGIFTERDLLVRVAGRIEDLSSVSVGNFSTPNPEALQLDDSIGSALHLMHVGGYRHIPLVDEKGEPAAVVSMKDVVSLLSEFFPEDVLNLPPKPLRTTSEREGA